jgi:hypothetical protein
LNAVHFQDLNFTRRDIFAALKARIKRKKSFSALLHTQKAVIQHAWVDDWSGRGSNKRHKQKKREREHLTQNSADAIKAIEQLKNLRQYFSPRNHENIFRHLEHKERERSF